MTSGDPSTLVPLVQGSCSMACWPRAYAAGLHFFRAWGRSTTLRSEFARCAT